MDRKAIARQTLDILKNGCYDYNGRQVDISQMQKRSVENSILYTPSEGAMLMDQYKSNRNGGISCTTQVENCPTADAILLLSESGMEHIGTLNFASAKNPGGGFLNGAKAQEESLAASSGLYYTLTRHETYYQSNRACKSMIYTNHAIYSPDVVFFRDGNFRLLPAPVSAGVLTLPAVNMGQVLLKGEDQTQAEQAMFCRMKLALAIFAQQSCRNLILGAYGCGVFRNDPWQIALWWKELLSTCFSGCFDHIFFAVLDHSSRQECYRAFISTFGE